MKTILIIEDDRALAATYRQKLKEAGFRVEVALDGVEGIRAVSHLRPAGVILDLLLPRIDGLEVLKFIRSHPELADTPVVVFSNSYMTNLVENAWREGADDCLMKASTLPPQLIATLRKVMSRPKRRNGSSPAPAAPLHPALAAPPIDVLGARQSAAVPPSAVPPAPAAPAGAFRPAAPAPPVPAPAPAPDYPAPPNPDTHFFTTRYGTSFLNRPDTDFHTQIRELFIHSTVPRLETIRQYAAGFIQTVDPALRLAQLDGLLRKTHALVGNAALAGCVPIAEYASLFEALLKGLRDNPGAINDSTRHTVGRTVETFGELLTNVTCLEESAPAPLSALVLEADVPTARAAVAALEGARFRVTPTVDAVEALSLLATRSYDLVVASIVMPGTTAFEVHAQMQLLPGNARTPMVFLTAWESFSSHLTDPVVAEHDLIGKPFQPVELTLKSLGQVLRARVRRAASRTLGPFSVPPSAAGAAPSY